MMKPPSMAVGAGLSSKGIDAIPGRPRSVLLQGGSLEGLITWNAPEDSHAVAGFRIYQGTETNLISEINNRNARQFRLKLPANTYTAVYVSAISKLRRESPKVQAIGKANTHQFATSGGTNGTSPSPPPGWTDEPSGGKYADYGGDDSGYR